MPPIRGAGGFSSYPSWQSQMPLPTACVLLEIWDNDSLEKGVGRWERSNGETEIIGNHFTTIPTHKKGGKKRWKDWLYCFCWACFLLGAAQWPVNLSSGSTIPCTKIGIIQCTVFLATEVPQKKQGNNLRNKVGGGQRYPISRPSDVLVVDLANNFLQRVVVGYDEESVWGGKGENLRLPGGEL